MNPVKQKLIAKFSKKFKDEYENQKEFFSKPETLKALGVIGVAMLSKFLVEKYAEDDIKNFLRRDKTAKDFLKYSSNRLDEEILSDLLRRCQNGEITPEEYENYLNDANISAEGFLEVAAKNNDFFSKIGNISGQLSAFINKHTDTATTALSYAYLFQYIVLQVIQLIQNSEHPSPYRVKYIQRLIRNLGALLKNQYKEISDRERPKWDAMINNLKKIDDLLLALGMATLLYFLNRKLLQLRSEEVLKEQSKDKICEDIPPPTDVSVNIIPFKITLDCPVETDDEIVPHTPFEVKLANIDCEVEETPEIVPDIVETPDLVTKAIIQNNKQKGMFPLLSVDSYVDQKTVIANLGDTSIFAPLSGYIESQQINQVVIRDISDTDDYLTEQIQLLSEKYLRLNNVKAFLKYYSTDILYPPMLAIAIVDDASTYNINSGIDDEWKKIKKEHKRFDKDYEKEIKDITGKKNVEKNAKNETLYKIKEQMEREEEIYYKHLKLLNEYSVNISKKTKAKSNEYELFEYYALTLGSIFNGLENPSTIETEFRNLIQEFTRKRFIVDEYKKTKLENKISSQIKDIEKGLTAGDWFKKAFEKYESNKKLSDVKSWLIGLANENKKLEGNEKIEAVNSVMFLFELYLNYDILVEKYNVIKKESTPKKETIVEGNEILKFTQEIWKDFDNLGKEIEEIQKIIDSLSMFTTYSIVEYAGEKYRLYSIAYKPKCKTEDKDYLAPKYGFGDIQYWLKYCSFATLASVTNPATGWSTGWIIPAPILLPVIYIPVKAIETKYGFIVMGLSICGIFLFPWVLFTNYSSNFALPLFDPTTMLKNEIEALKKGIGEQLAKLRKISVKAALDITKTKLDAATQELEDYKERLQKHKETKPPKYPKTQDFKLLEIEREINKNFDYAKELEKWIKTGAELRELIAVTTTKKWRLEQQYSVLNSAYKDGTSVKDVDKTLKQEEELINKQLDKLTAAVDNLDKVVAALPIAMPPESTNFGITLKNTKPLIKIADELADNINEGPLDEITKKFKLKSEDLMSSKYGAKLSTSIVNSKAYKNALGAAKLAIIKKDPFPAYEQLTPTNLPWAGFLYKDFVTTGSTTFGWPGYAPFPI